MYKYGFIFILLFTSAKVTAQNKVLNSFGKGVVNVVSKDSSFSTKLGLRIQSLYQGEWNVNDTAGFDAGKSSFLIRRARIKLDGFAFTPKLQYKIELGLSGRDMGKPDERTGFAPRIIFDAVLKWNFYKNFTLWAGQTKLPGNRERVISSANMQLVDRSLLNAEFNIDRDIGFQLHHFFKIGKQFLVKEVFAFSQGEGRNLIQDNLGGFEYTGRIELLPFGEFSKKGDYIGGDLSREDKPKLSIAATYDYNDRAVKTRSNQGSYMTFDYDKDDKTDDYFHSNITTIFADLMFKYKGFSLMSEYAFRDASNVAETRENDDFSMTTRAVSTGSGFNIQAGYLFKNNWEIATRYTQIVPDKKGANQYEQYTLGVSKYIVGHKLKVQADVSYLKTNHSSDSKLMTRLQIEMHL